MASDNTTTYNVVVETEVTGGEEVKQLGDDAEGAGGKFKSLRGQIRETTVGLQKLADEGKQGTAEFEKLRAKLDELNDAQDKVNFQAGQFDDQLASLPGPIGQVGGAIQGFNEGLNKFSLGFKLALGAVGLIIGAFAALKESLSRTEEGQAKLNKISEAFTKIMNGVFAVIEPIAMALADLVIGLLENDKVMKVLSTTMGVLSGAFTAVFGVAKELGGFIINNLVNSFKTLVGVASGAGKVLKGVFTFDLDLIKEGVSQVGDTVKTGFNSFVDNAKSTAKGIGTAVVNGVKTGFEAGSKSFSEGAKRLTEAEKKAAEEAAAKRKERGAKAAEEAKKLEEQRLKDLEAANKVLTEAYLSGLEDRDKEIYKRGEKLNADILALEKAGITDRTAVLEAYNRDVDAINTKFDEDQKKKDEEKKQKALETAKLLFEEAQRSNENRTAALEQRYNKEIALINEKEKMMLSVEGLSEEQRKQIRETAANERLTQQTARYDELIAIIDEKEKIALSNLELTESQKTKIVLDAQAERSAVEKTRIDDELLGIENELALLTTTFDRRKELIGQKEAELLTQEGITENQRTQIKQQAADERAAIDMAELEARAEMQNAYLDLAGQFGSFLKEIAGKNKKLAIAGVIVEQAAAIGKIVVNTGIANAKALAASPLTFGQPWIAINTISAALSIASSVAAGIKAIQQINSADSGTAPTSGGSLPRSSGGAGGASTAPVPPTLERAAVPQITGTQGQASPGQQIAQTLAARTDKPLKAYVVSGDVTSQQALDRRTTRAATFSGGTNG
jgi:cytochrome c556